MPKVGRVVEDFRGRNRVPCHLNRSLLFANLDILPALEVQQHARFPIATPQGEDAFVPTRLDLLIGGIEGLHAKRDSENPVSRRVANCGVPFHFRLVHGAVQRNGQLATEAPILVRDLYRYLPGWGANAQDRPNRKYQQTQ
jgi:hypothetical protein